MSMEPSMLSERVTVSAPCRCLSGPTASTVPEIPPGALALRRRCAAIARKRHILEEHPGRLARHPERLHDIVEASGDDAELRGRHRLERVDELSLRGRHRPLEERAARGGEGELGATAVVVGAAAPNEPAIDEPRDHHRHRALVRERPIGELVHRKRRRLGEPLKHEQLRRAHLPPLLGEAMRLV